MNTSVKNIAWILAATLLPSCKSDIEKPAKVEKKNVLLIHLFCTN